MSLEADIDQANRAIELLRSTLTILANQRAEALKDILTLVDAGADTDEMLVRLRRLDDAIAYHLHGLQRVRRVREHYVWALDSARLTIRTKP
jgi:hypothetical protein